MIHNQRDFTAATPGFCAGLGYVFSIIDPADLDEQTYQAWDSLSHDAEQPNPFFTPWFLLPAIRWLDREKAVRLLLIHDDAGMLVGLMPVIGGATYAQLPLRHLSVWKNNHIYVGTPLLRRGHSAGAMQALVSWVGSRASAIHFLHMTQLCAAGPVYHALDDALRMQGRRTILRRRRSRAILHQGHDFETLIDTAYSPKKRSELRRRFRRFDELGRVSLTEDIISPEEAPALAKTFMHLENDGWKNASPEGFALAKSDAEMAFFHDVIQCGAAGGHIRATVLSCGDTPAAIGFTLRSGQALFGFKTAFDRRHARFSPGIRIFHETTRRMLSDPTVTLYDSCAMPGHPVIDPLWPDRLDGVEIDILAQGRITVQAMNLAMQIANARQRLSSMFHREGSKRKA